MNIDFKNNTCYHQEGALLIIMPLFLLIAGFVSLAYFECVLETIKLYQTIRRSDSVNQQRFRKLAQHVDSSSKGGCQSLENLSFCLSHPPQTTLYTSLTDTSAPFVDWPDLLKNARTCQSPCLINLLNEQKLGVIGSVNSLTLTCQRLDSCTLAASGAIDIKGALIVSAPTMLISAQDINIGALVLLDPSLPVTLVSTQGAINITIDPATPTINRFSAESSPLIQIPNGLVPPRVSTLTKIYQNEP
jgi:hypothetical protein